MICEDCNIVVNSLFEYFSIIKNLNGINYFRGQNSHFYNLEPSLYRNVAGLKSSLVSYEEFMIITAKNRFPELFKKVQTPLHELCIMQHYGLPTRLLDISENSLVALYFACQGNDSSKKDNGQVYIFKEEGFRDTSIRNYAIQNLISETYLLYGLTLEEIYDFMIRQDYSKKEISHIQYSEEKRKYIKNNFVPQIIDAPYSLSRQNAQKAKYILVPEEIPSNNSNEFYSLQRNTLHNFKKLNEMPCEIITISKENKDDILNDLDLIGINQNYIFPEKDIYYEKGFRKIKEEAEKRLRNS